MRWQRIALPLVVLTLIGGWLFWRPARRADLLRRINEDRCCFEGYARYPNLCTPALDDLERMPEAQKCPALAERNSRDPALRLCGYLASTQDREAAARELGDKLPEAAARPACTRQGRMVAMRAALEAGCGIALALAQKLPGGDPQRAAILRRCNQPADVWQPPPKIVAPPYSYAGRRTDAVSGLDACEKRIFECQYGNLRSLDACAVSMPACKTGRFWEEQEVCCPEVCADRYVEARRAGKQHLEAMRFGYEECTP